MRKLTIMMEYCNISAVLLIPISSFHLYSKTLILVCPLDFVLLDLATWFINFIDFVCSKESQKDAPCSCLHASVYDSVRSIRMSESFVWHIYRQLKVCVNVQAQGSRVFHTRLLQQWCFLIFKQIKWQHILCQFAAC